MNRAKRISGAFLAAMTLLSACAESNMQAPSKNAVKPDKAEIKAVEAVIPDPVAEGTDASKFVLGDAHWEWWQDYREKVDASRNRQEGMEQYYALIQKELLDNAADGNAVCSPLNIYIALSMLAEVTDGNTQKQILNVLKAKDMDVLRERTKALWDANYLDTPVVKSLLANSMWLRNDIGYHEDTLKRLAEEYHASSYSGEMGSDQLNEQLRKWTDEHTGGLLTEYTKELELQPEGVLALISTIYYKASWNEKFLKDQTEEGIFHGLAGDQAVPMMHRDDMMSLYQTEHFQAVGLNLADSGTMYFFLPKEGCTAQNIAADPEMIRICMDPSGMNSDYPLVHLTVPKFDVSDKIDLPDHLKALGIKDALSAEAADFSPLTEEVKRIWLSGAEHAAMVKIDEEGVTGAAYTDLAMAGAGMPQDEVDFVLDRPFVFAVTSPDGSILFAGVVQNAEDSFSGGIYVPADKKRLTGEQALEMIRNYCYSSNPELKEMEQSDKYTIGWDVSTKEEKEIVVLYRSYTGAQIRYYIDPVSGETYVTELVPGIINEEQRTDESFNIWDTLATEAGNTIPEERNWDRIPTVMIDGALYESTGYISSAIGCGNMDGKITSSVEGNEEPAKNDQSNFGVGYEYQRSSEGQIVVVMDGMKVIFRDPKHSFTVDIPEEVLNFNAEVLEVRNGSLLVSFISTPDIFTPPFTGQCVVRVNPQILKEEVKAGDTVRVWFDGLVQEIYPPILPNVYRVVKEEQEPAEPEPSETKVGTQREDGFTLTEAFDIS